MMVTIYEESQETGEGLCGSLSHSLYLPYSSSSAHTDSLHSHEYFMCIHNNNQKLGSEVSTKPFLSVAPCLPLFPNSSHHQPTYLICTYVRTFPQFTVSWGKIPSASSSSSPFSHHHPAEEMKIRLRVAEKMWLRRRSWGDEEQEKMQ